MLKLFITFCTLLVLFITSCVTVNIYFPAAAAEQVADEIIEGIQGPQSPNSKTIEPESKVRFWQHFSSRVKTIVFDFGISSAQAAQAKLSIDSPEIRNLRASMKTRFAKLKPYYSNGLIGIGSNGLIKIRDKNRVPLKDRNSVNKLVANENRDRQALYLAIANANGHPEWVVDIKATFAKQWVSNAYPGWLYEDAGGNWHTK